MTAAEEFDKAAREAEATLNEYPIKEIDSGFFKDLLDKLNSIVLQRTRRGSDSAQMARNIAAAIKVLIASRGLLSDDEKFAFAKTLEVLQAEYMAARTSALQANAPQYTITAALRGQTATLTAVYKRAKANTAVMAQVSDALGGLSALISAIA